MQRGDSSSLFFLPISWICQDMSFQTHQHPVYCDVEIHEPSTLQMFYNHKNCESIKYGGALL